MNTKRKEKLRPVIARFSNYDAKSRPYKARLNLRNADLKDVGAEKIFIYENLTARKVKKKITMVRHRPLMAIFFLKTDITSKVLKIDSHEDLKGL